MDPFVDRVFVDLLPRVLHCLDLTLTSMVSVLFIIADYGHDPTEAAIPYAEFKKANDDITFVTETGNVPKCDAKMLEGITQKLLGVTRDACGAYDNMKAGQEIKRPKKWSNDDFK